MRKKQKSRVKLILWLGAINLAIYTFVGYGIKDLFTGTRIIIIVNAQEAREDIKPTQAPKEPENPAQLNFDPKSTIQRTATEEGIDWKILFAICMEESYGCTNPKELGDGGKSRGYFQIYKTAHPEITDEQAYDLEWSSHWTAQRLKRYAEKGGWDYAIRKHNGNADINEGKWKASYKMTADYLVRIKQNIKTL